MELCRTTCLQNSTENSVEITRVARNAPMQINGFVVRECFNEGVGSCFSNPRVSVNLLQSLGLIC